MATQTLLGKPIPPKEFTGNRTGFDNQSVDEDVWYALNGIEAISAVIQDNIDGEHKGHWSDDFIWHLTQGQQALVAFARRQNDLLRHELWFAKALLGEYGPEAQARTRRELGDAESERAA